MKITELNIYEIEALYRTLENTPISSIPRNKAEELHTGFLKIREHYFNNVTKTGEQE